MSKINCWEYKKCGREPGGARAEELGVCPAAVEMKVDGVNGGRKAGRACWVVAGTLSGNDPKGLLARKLADCRRCDFYRKVRREMGSELYDTGAIYVKLR